MNGSTIKLLQWTHSELLAFLALCSGGNSKDQAVELPEQPTVSSMVIDGKLMLAMDPLPRNLGFLILQFVTWQ